MTVDEQIAEWQQRGIGITVGGVNLSALTRAESWRQASLDLPESEFTKLVIGFAECQGWTVYHQRPARTAQGWRTALQGRKGFPDLVMLRHGRLIVAELKSAKGTLSADQVWWRNEFRKCQVPWPNEPHYVWRPVDWPSIVEVLK